MEVLPWNWLKWRKKSMPKECWGYFSHHLDDYKLSPLEEILGPTGIVVETRAKNCSDFLSTEVIINCYPNFMTCFYFSRALDQIAATVN